MTGIGQTLSDDGTAIGGYQCQPVIAEHPLDSSSRQEHLKTWNSLSSLYRVDHNMCLENCANVRSTSNCSFRRFLSLVSEQNQGSGGSVFSPQVKEATSVISPFPVINYAEKRTVSQLTVSFAWEVPIAATYLLCHRTPHQSSIEVSLLYWPLQVST